MEKNKKTGGVESSLDNLPKGKMTTDNTEKKNVRNYRKDAPGATSGINSPGIELPAFNPPVPNRAWTEMRSGADIDELTEQERRNLYLGRDQLL